MCNTPVTFGGGITTVKDSRPSGTERKSPLSIHVLYHLSSIEAGLYCLGISILMTKGGKNSAFFGQFEFE
jgi:hypothetical protein